MSMFDIFENRWTISAVLELETPLHIGGGQNAASYSISSASILQTYNAQMQTYEPYIPGSSLKGVLRCALERLIRTFNEENSCISSNCNNGKCITCTIFGSMNTGAKIRIRDSHLLEKSKRLYGSIKDQPHCATKYKINEGKFETITRIRIINNKKIKVADTFMRTEEIVVPGLCFDIQIDIDNANTIEVGLLLLALDEFNKKRINIGGASSRGNGFVKVNNISVRKKTIDDRLNISESTYDTTELMKDGKKYLKNIDSGRDSGRRDFDIYYKAHLEERTGEGFIVALVKVITLADFIMPGAEEETVTCNGIPFIPGSTIKGYFRHKLIYKGINANTINEIFGSADKDSRSHRSRLLFSDAYCDRLTDSKKIPTDSILKMWLIFDNMTKEEISLIYDLIKMDEHVITGKRSSKWNNVTKLAKNNRIKMEIENIDIFKTFNYIKSI